MNWIPEQKYSYDKLRLLISCLEYTRDFIQNDSIERSIFTNKVNELIPIIEKLHNYRNTIESEMKKYNNLEVNEYFINDNVIRNNEVRLEIVIGISFTLPELQIMYAYMTYPPFENCFLHNFAKPIIMEIKELIVHHSSLSVMS